MREQILIDALEIISQTVASTPSHSKIAAEALSQYSQIPFPQTSGAVWEGNLKERLREDIAYWQSFKEGQLTSWHEARFTYAKILWEVLDNL